MLEQIRELEEFTAAEGTFTQDVDLEEDAVPGSRASSAGNASSHWSPATVRATVDFGQLDESSIEVDEDETTIRITLPEPVLSDADIEESAARIVSRDRGLLDRVDDFFAGNPTDDARSTGSPKRRSRQQPRESDLVERSA